MEDWETGGTEVASQAITFGKPGDFIKGTYTGKKLVKANDKETLLYELKAAVGSYHNVDSKKNPIEPAVTVQAGAYYNVWGGKDAIDSLFSKSKLGDVVAVKLEAEVESKTKGHAPFKKYKTLQFGPDSSYMGEDSSVAAVSETLGVESVEDGPGF